MLLEVLKNLETIILEGNKKAITSNNLPFSSVFSRAILEITELVVTLMELYLKARLVVQLVFSFLPRLLKITGQFRMTMYEIIICLECSTYLVVC
jgi:hypothetical protein